MNETIVVALIGLAGGYLLKPLLEYLFGRRRQRAEVESLVVASTGKAIEYWQTIADDVRKEMESMKVRMEFFEQRTDRLENALEYLMKEVEPQFPTAVEIAREIAKMERPEDVIPKPRGSPSTGSGSTALRHPSTTLRQAQGAGSGYEAQGASSGNGSPTGSGHGGSA